ncbi:hypothetical protein DOY81_010108 [Sarcophaga bullata]|nr:hypothetical protein DOY81_010108 [Sarcophaga bullata]
MIPPELLFQMQQYSTTKAETRRRRDIDISAALNDDDDFNELMGVASSPTMRTNEDKKKKRKKKKKLDASETSDKIMDMYNTIYSIRLEMDKIRKPTGSQDNPGRTCRDLYYAHPQFEDNWYWLDPNGGMPDDAIRVYCKMSSEGETCIYPDVHTTERPMVPMRHGGREKQWFSQMPGGNKITYDGVGTVQLTFLKLLSKEAYQNFTYYCRNSVAWHDSTRGNYDKALHFLGCKK